MAAQTKPRFVPCSMPICKGCAERDSWVRTEYGTGTPQPAMLVCGFYHEPDAVCLPFIEWTEGPA